MATLEELTLVKRRHSADLLRRPGVCGVDIDVGPQGDAVFTIHLERDDPGIRSGLPEMIEGHKVNYVRTGPFEKQ
jgi:hypothetical protein